MTTIYKVATGEVIFSAQHAMRPEEIAAALTQHPGSDAIDAYVPWGTSYVVSGRAVEVGPPPNSFTRFDIETKQWVEIYDGAEIDSVKRERTKLLAQSDWTQMPDVEIKTKSEWAAYRQELRDVTDQPGYPRNIIWPTPPK